MNLIKCFDLQNEVMSYPLRARQTLLSTDLKIKHEETIHNYR